MEFKRVPLKDINKGVRYRTEYTGIEELAGSVSEIGLLVPIVLSPDLLLLAGGRRMKAFEHLKLDEIPAVIIDPEDELEVRVIEHTENAQRQDLTYKEDCDLTAEVDRLMKLKHGDKSKNRRDETAWSQEKTAALLGRSRTQVTDDINLSEIMKIFPVVSEAKNKSDAVKVAKRLTEGVILTEMLSRQATDKEVPGIVTAAQEAYRIGEAYEGLCSLETGSMNFAEVDPPYAIELGKKKKAASADDMKSYDEMDPETYIEEIEALAIETYRVLADNSWCVWWFGMVPWYDLITVVLSGVGFKVDMMPCIWTKPSGQCMQPEIHLSNNYETFLMLAKGKPVINKRGRSNVYEGSDFPPVSPQKKIHKTEKPIALLDEIFATLAPPVGNVVIPFLGSGVSIHASFNKGLKPIGWDLSEEHRNRFLGRITMEI